MRVTKKFQKWNQMKTSLNAVVAYSAVGDVPAVCVSRYAVLETLKKMKKTLNWSQRVDVRVTCTWVQQLRMLELRMAAKMMLGVVADAEAVVVDVVYCYYVIIYRIAVVAAAAVVLVFVDDDY